MGFIKRYKNSKKFQTKDEMARRKRIISFIKTAVLFFVVGFATIYLAILLLNIVFGYFLSGIRW